LKTIRQIAEEIGASKQAVYKRYKGKLYKSVFPYVRIIDGSIYILEQGETIIKQDFSGDSISYGAHTSDTLIFMLHQELKNRLVLKPQFVVINATNQGKT
jgi:hypothetical protein